MSRWCQWPGSNVMPKPVAEAVERRQLQGKGQTGVVFVPLRICKCRERLGATFFFFFFNAKVRSFCLKGRNGYENPGLLCFYVGETPGMT